MARPTGNKPVDLSESSVYGNDPNDNAANNRGDTADDGALDRLENLTGGAEEPAIFEDGKLASAMDEFDAQTSEEIEALELDLMQDGPRTDTSNGSGRIVDDLSEEQITEFTEVGPDIEDRGARSVAPSLDDTSAILRRHQANQSNADVSESNLDEPRDAERSPEDNATT